MPFYQHQKNYVIKKLVEVKNSHFTSIRFFFKHKLLLKKWNYNFLLGAFDILQGQKWVTKSNMKFSIKFLVITTSNSLSSWHTLHRCSNTLQHFFVKNLNCYWSHRIIAYSYTSVQCTLLYRVKLQFWYIYGTLQQEHLRAQRWREMPRLIPLTGFLLSRQKIPFSEALMSSYLSAGLSISK